MSNIDPISVNEKTRLNLNKEEIVQNSNEEENYFLSLKNNANEYLPENIETDTGYEKKFNLKLFFKELTDKTKAFFGCEDSSYDVNGKIDKEFYQGMTGDCTLLSALYSISTTKQGQQAIEEAITINKGLFGQIKSYDVYFKGIDETYTITKKELEKAEKIHKLDKGSYSDGDDDVLLLELAWQKCTKEAKDKLDSFNFSYVFFGSGLEGVDPLKFTYCLTGAKYRNVHFESQYRTLQGLINSYEILEAFENKAEFKLEEITEVPQDSEYSYSYCGFEFNQKDIYEILEKPSQTENQTITIKNKTTNQIETFDAQKLAENLGSLVLSQETKDLCFEESYKEALEADFVTFGTNFYLGEAPEYKMTDIYGKDRKIIFSHSYAVKSINENEIIIINPHNSKEELIFSKEELKKHSDIFSFIMYDFPEE